MNSPTPTQLLQQMLTTKSDQLCLVRKRRGLDQTGILVLLVGEKAIAKIGGGILAFVKAHPEFLPPGKLTEIDWNQSHEIILNWLERQRRNNTHHWAYGTFALADGTATRHSGAFIKPPTPMPSRPPSVLRPLHFGIFAFTGDAVCAALAPELTTRGLPCSLSVIP